ncbi:Transposase, IS4 family [Leptospira santarosai]|uniref:Transposase, IS4 family n=1 Tax=Leptospira santarosai TaxID=28183 RepID=A0A2P1QNV9_9LEPT|nr:Transposase, IS4 family [Leptospira santarosai]
MNVPLKLKLKEWYQMVTSQELPKSFHWSQPDGSRQKRHILVDRRGAPVTFVIASAGTHVKLLFHNLKKIRILRNSKFLNQEILSLDKYYATNAIKAGLKKKSIRYGIPNKKNARNPEWIAPLNPFRRTVKRTFVWFNAFRTIKTCWEFKFENYTAF